MNNTHSTAIERTCRRCGITIVGTGYACPGEPGELCSTHCLESAYEPPALGSVHEIQRTLDCLIRVPDKQPPLGDGDDSTRLVVPAHKMADLERELAVIAAARDTALARVRELEADGRRLDWLEHEYDGTRGISALGVWLLEKACNRKHSRSLRAAIDAAIVAASARAAGTGEEGQ